MRARESTQESTPVTARTQRTDCVRVHGDHDTQEGERLRCGEFGLLAKVQTLVDRVHPNRRTQIVSKLLVELQAAADQPDSLL